MKNVNLSPIRLYIVPVLVVLSILLLVPLVLMPQLDQIKEKNLEVKKGQERLDVLNTKLESLATIDEDEEGIKLIEAEQVVPSGKDLAALVVGVRSLAGQANLQVAGMELFPGKVATQSASVSASKRAKAAASKNKKAEDKEKITFSLALKTKRINDLQKFLNNIEKAKRLLGINSIELTREEKGVYRFDLEIIAPFRGIRSSGDVLASPLPPFTQTHQSIFDFVTNFINYTNVAVQKVKTGVTDPFE